MKLLSLFMFCSFVTSAFAFRTSLAFWKNSQQTPLVMVWNTTNTSSGSSPADQITLPLAAGSTYDFVVDWGDGTSQTVTTSTPVTHSYPFPGVVTITIKGRLDRLYFNNGGDRLKLLEIISWGSNVWKNMNGAFAGCANLNITATDAPDLSQVTSMAQMFFGASSFNGNISAWNTSNVTDMSMMFYGASAFNQNIGSWNTSAVTLMTGMFWSATAFNQNISSWSTGAVTNMASMFQLATSFNQNLSGWNVAAVTGNTNYRLGASAWVLPKPSGFP